MQRYKSYLLQIKVYYSRSLGKEFLFFQEIKGYIKMYFLKLYIQECGKSLQLQLFN